MNTRHDTSKSLSALLWHPYMNTLHIILKWIECQTFKFSAMDGRCPSHRSSVTTDIVKVTQDIAAPFDCQWSITPWIMFPSVGSCKESVFRISNLAPRGARDARILAVGSQFQQVWLKILHTICSLSSKKQFASVGAPGSYKAALCEA